MIAWKAFQRSLSPYWVLPREAKRLALWFMSICVEKSNSKEPGVKISGASCCSPLLAMTSDTQVLLGSWRMPSAMKDQHTRITSTQTFDNSPTSNDSKKNKSCTCAVNELADRELAPHLHVRLGARHEE